MAHAEEITAQPKRQWISPSAWLTDKRLSHHFWTFFTAAFFFDFGFSVYFFLFNLFLLDLHFDDRAIGLVGGAFTLGSLAGTLPAGLMARRFGLRPALLVCFIAAPILCALRVCVPGQTAQLALTFFAGVATCVWAVCFLPAVANLTTPENRAFAFSLIFSVSIGTSALGGLLCGYLPLWLARAGWHPQPFEVKRIILLSACALAALGLFSVIRMQDAAPSAEAVASLPCIGRKWWHLDPFLFRFLPAMALWAAVLAAFTPFANVFLSRQLHVPMLRIGLLFSAAQLVQFLTGLLTPVLFRRCGLVGGVALTQIITGVLLGLLASTQNTPFALALYLGFSATQWMCSPGLYNLLMSRVPEAERSIASGVTMFTNALIGSAATAGCGILFTRFGYPPVLFGIASVAMLAAVVFYFSAGGGHAASTSTPPAERAAGQVHP